MPTGTVKWFNNAKGFGFILPEGGGDDLFAHYSSIEMEGYKTLKAGQSVSFEVSDTDKGGHAKHIRVISASGGDAPAKADTPSTQHAHSAEEREEHYAEHEHYA